MSMAAGRWLLCLTVLVIMGACSTLKPIEMPADEVQRMILAGEIPLQGEAIKVFTEDGQSHEFRVTEVDTEKRLIRGKNKFVPIDDVVAIETKEFSIGKTALLAGSSYLLIALIVVAATPVFVL